MEKLKVTRDPTYPKLYWNVRGEDGGLRAVLYNPAAGHWFLHTTGLPTAKNKSIQFTTKAACIAWIHGYQDGWLEALAVRDYEDEQRAALLEGV